MEKLKGFDFQALDFDNDGKPKGTGIDELAKFVKDNAVTDVIFMCHGFRNDANDARGLYGGFLETFAKNAQHASLAPKLGTRKFAVGGAFWPSMVLPEPDDSGQGSAQSIGNITTHKKRLEGLKAFVKGPDKKRIDKLVALASDARDDEKKQLEMVKQLLAIVENLPVENGNEMKAAFKKADPETLRAALSLGADDLTVETPGGGGGAMVGIPGMDAGGGGAGEAQSFLGKIFGFVPKFVNLSTFLIMFSRCEEIGSNGLAKAVRTVRAASSGVRVHLVGHSLGGRAVTACAKSLLAAPAVKVDTMMLLQAAYSHFGLAPKGDNHPRGHFRDVIEKKVVKGPILATHSEKDSVVGVAYTAMAAVSLNNARAFGDENSRFGGIGRNGVLDTPEVVKLDLKLPGNAYSLDASKITTLNGSVLDDGKPLIQSHGDVRNAAVTWAFASLVASS